MPMEACQLSKGIQTQHQTVLSKINNIAINAVKSKHDSIGSIESSENRFNTQRHSFASNLMLHNSSKFNKSPFFNIYSKQA